MTTVAKRRCIASALAGLAMWLAGFLLWQLAPGLDFAVIDAIRATPGSIAARIARFVTFFGDYPRLIALSLIGAVWLVLRRDRRSALWLAAVTLAGRALVELHKAVLDRPRPPAVERLVEVHSASFPSAHAFNSMLVALALVAAFGGRCRGVAVALGFSLAVGTSRIVLGVHWPSDVVAGWGAAIVWLIATRVLLQPAGRAETRSG